MRSRSCADEACLTDPLGAVALAEARSWWPWAPSVTGAEPEELGEGSPVGQACPPCPEESCVKPTVLVPLGLRQ
ncbi:hypothetical protein NDU88_006537 [Pleurodeles waltl]|uniref:Uncharacterized protein n=1 Tax=Pleurodeles waltl TaxID=8319 RepID=A0AAV7WDX0_PLEWA|nr:hypothetical protein NDU88_006537 [Pleurodeles waltl]